MAVAGVVMGCISVPISLIMIISLLTQDAKLQDKKQLIDSETNMKEIGLVFRIWAGNHNDEYPFNVSQADGGTRELCHPDENGVEQNPVPTFMVMSNELSTPAFLVAHNDPTKKWAESFETLTISNITYLLRTGTNVNEMNPLEIMLIDPANGGVLQPAMEAVKADKSYKQNP